MMSLYSLLSSMPALSSFSGFVSTGFDGWEIVALWMRSLCPINLVESHGSRELILPKNRVGSSGMMRKGDFYGR